MSGLRPALLAAAAAVLLLAGPCLSKVTEAYVDKDDRCSIPITEPFGFGSDGRVTINLTDFKAFSEVGTKKKINYKRLGFFIATYEAGAQFDEELSECRCALDDDVDAQTSLPLFTLQDSKSMDVNETFELALLLEPYSGGQYSLYFANCESDLALSFDIRAALYNVKGARRDYLSVGEDMLPLMYMVMFVLFTVATVLWTTMVLKAGKIAHKVHYLMIVLVIFKTLTLLTQAGRYHMIGLTGYQEGWNWAYYLFTFIRGILFFTVVILIGTGWSYMKPFIAEREKNILLVVLPLQILANVAIVVIDENTPASKFWFVWTDVLHLVDIICCCAILFPIVWSIKHLREASHTDGKAARNLVKLTLFRQFYVMVVSYIYFTRIVVYLLKNTMPYQYVWFADASAELAALAFYTITAIKFRPHTENPYFELSTEEDIELSR